MKLGYKSSSEYIEESIKYNVLKKSYKPYSFNEKVLFELVDKSELKYDDYKNNLKYMICLGIIRNKLILNKYIDIYNNLQIERINNDSKFSKVDDYISKDMIIDLNNHNYNIDLTRYVKQDIKDNTLECYFNNSEYNYLDMCTDYIKKNYFNHLFGEYGIFKHYKSEYGYTAWLSYNNKRYNLLEKDLKEIYSLKELVRYNPNLNEFQRSEIVINLLNFHQSNYVSSNKYFVEEANELAERHNSGEEVGLRGRLRHSDLQNKWLVNSLTGFHDRKKVKLIKFINNSKNPRVYKCLIDGYSLIDTEGYYYWVSKMLNKFVGFGGDELYAEMVNIYNLINLDKNEDIDKICSKLKIKDTLSNEPLFKIDNTGFKLELID